MQPHQERADSSPESVAIRITGAIRHGRLGQLRTTSLKDAISEGWYYGKIYREHATLAARIARAIARETLPALSTFRARPFGRVRQL